MLRMLLAPILSVLLAVAAAGRTASGPSAESDTHQAPVLPAKSVTGVDSEAGRSTGFAAEPQGLRADLNRDDTTTLEAQSVIRVHSTLVTVPVSVTDASGGPVRDLAPEAFRIEEEGRVQGAVSLGRPGETPVDLALLIDVSASVRERLLFEKEAARRFLDFLLRPKDSVSVFSVGLEPKLVQARTSDTQRAAAAIAALQPTAQATAFFDAVVEAALYLGATEEPELRHILVVISDGEDNHSDRHTLQDALGALLRSDSLFYSINPSGPSLWLNRISTLGQKAMETLALETGGAFVVDASNDLEMALQRIAAELRAQYLLGYYRRDAESDGGFRRIVVTVPGRPEVRVRARRGYYARSASGH
ncbi:MAG: VWA domain-containing protein [Acidobacteria bacterium]|nr:VWA domain-containing protein [Acidobacteriota bacterium]